MRNVLVVTLLSLSVLLAGEASARSPRGTLEYAAEGTAISKMQQYYPAYNVRDAQMRSNRLSIAIPTVNAKGKQVNFKCDVQKRTRRDGSWYYEVGMPQLGS